MSGDLRAGIGKLWEGAILFCLKGVRLVTACTDVGGAAGIVMMMRQCLKDTTTSKRGRSPRSWMNL
ncbi:MAG: hypothetical protein MJZ72_05530 [Bacteroidales bacterium]|nr:hypothetical protein [Bacteroidales bacterium]